MVKHIKPGKTIGILGGGQLGRMMAMAAKQMGYQIAIMDPTSNSPTGQVADYEITASYDDPEGAKQLLEASDVITYEFESIDLGVCEHLEENGYVPQGSDLIRISQDRAFEKEAITASGGQVVPYYLVDHLEDLNEAVSALGFPCVLKTRRGGYDGKGQYIIKNVEALEEAAELLEKGPCILEKFLPFEKELSVMVIRSVKGETITFPVSENIHEDHILLQSIVPARITAEVEEKAKHTALQLAESINMIGTLGVEMFLTEDGEVFINEVAPRPHNSGHYTMDASNTSQFEQHIRAITGMALTEPKLHQPVVMMNVLGEHLLNVMEIIPNISNAKIHLYGKADVKPKRKMGHVNFIGDHTKELLQQIRDLGIWRH